MFDVSLFFPISPSAPLLFLAASLHPLSGICAVSACIAHHSALPVSYCYSSLPCPIHVSHLPLVSIVCHSGCSRCLFLLSFSFCLILLSVSVSMLLFCTPSVGWLRWLFSFLSVHRGRLLLVSFISGPSLRCIASVVCLGSLYDIVCYITVPSVLCLCHPPVTSIIVRPPHHLCLCGSTFVYCLRRRCVCQAEVTSPGLYSSGDVLRKL